MELQDLNYSHLLLKLARTRDRAVFGKIFLHYAPLIKTYMCEMGADDQEAEDLTQQVLLQVWHTVDTYEATSTPASTWIFTLARNLRSEKLKEEKHFAYDDTQAQIDSSANHQGQSQPQGLSVSKHPHLNAEGLNPQEKEVIALSFCKGLSHRQISEELQLPLDEVETIIKLAYINMKQHPTTVRPH